MTLEVWQGFAQNDAGDVLDTATVTVTLAGTATKPDLFADADGVSSKTNPFNTDSTGFVQFYTAPAIVDIVATKGAFTVTFSNVRIGLPDALQTVATLAELQALPVPTGFRMVTVGGFYGEGDGGGGDFYWKSNSSETAVAGMIVQADGYAGTGRWTRAWNSEIYPEWTGAVGDGVVLDDTALTLAHNSLPAIGGTIVLSKKFKVNSTFTVSKSNVTLRGTGGGGLVYTTATLNPLLFSGAKCAMDGVVIDAPATFDATNAPPSYGVVKVTGDDFTGTKNIINNVPRTGFWFSDVNKGILSCNRILGGTTEGFFTGTNTFHFGIYIDPKSTGNQGSFAIGNNYIERCVQGAGSGNFGGASYEQGLAFVGNTVHQCWNHGWYTSGFGNGVTVSANTFTECQIPVALSGWNHVVSANTMTLQTTGTGLATDNEITGISMRDPYGCIIVGNTLKGEGVNGGVVIDLQDNGPFSGANRVENNIVSSNVIEITNPLVAGTVAIRLDASSSLVRNNTVSGNVITCPIRSLNALISVTASASSNSSMNKIVNNTVEINGARGNGYGIFLSNIIDSDVSGNSVEIAYDDTVARTHFAYNLSTCSNIETKNNLSKCSALFGTNITVHVFRELTSASGHNYSGNKIRMDLTKLAGKTDWVTLAGGGSTLDHVGTGSPEGLVIAAIGSQWRRKDGGAGTSLYIKESGTSNTGWIGK